MDKWLKRPIAVLDLRGNGGGSDQMASWLASRVSGKPTVWPYQARFTLKTPEAKATRANVIKFEILMNEHRKKAVPDYSISELKERMLEFRTARNTNATGYDEKRFDVSSETESKNSYKGKLFVLIDAGCASACEGAVKFFESIPGVTTIGENTGGYFQFGNLGIVVLPHSNLNVQIPTSYFQMRDQSNIEKVGIAPKIRVDAGQDALEYTLKHAM